MRTIIFLLLVIWFVSALGQRPQQQFMNHIVTETNSVIMQEIPNDSGNLIMAKLPSYYDYEWLVRKLKTLIDANENTEVLNPWRFEEDVYKLYILAWGNGMAIQFDPEKNMLYMTYTVRRTDL